MPEQVKAGAPDFSNWSCPLPLADYPTIVMGHGGGGKLGNELVEHLFLPAFRNPALENLGDAAVLDLPPGRLVMSTDSFVVQPLFFPGGSIGELAVNGTVNDLAVSGAEPRFLSASFILEEGFPLAQLAAIVASMAKAAATAGVQIVTGDTKVVERGHGDGCYINTAGVGVLRRRNHRRPASRATRRCRPRLRHHRRSWHGHHERSRRPRIRKPDPFRLRRAQRYDCRRARCGRQLGPRHARPHPRRPRLHAERNRPLILRRRCHRRIQLSRFAPKCSPPANCWASIRSMSPTRAKRSSLSRPTPPRRFSASCAGIHLGRDAARIGTVTGEHKRMLVARTAMGANRVIPTQIGEQLPRIC